MTQKIKVLECIRQGQIGGGESHLLSLVQNLDRSRFNPIVLSFTDGPMIEKMKELRVSTQVIHTTKPFDFFKWKAIKKFIKDNQVDIVHAHGTRANSNVLWPASSLHIPVIYTVHGWSFHQDQNLLVKKMRILGEKYLTSKSDINISVSVSNQQSGKNYLRKFNSVVINNGIDQKKFDPTRQYKKIREALNIPESDILVLFIARFTAHKQPLSLIRAFQIAVQSYPQMHLLMVGDGDQKKEAEALIANNEIKNKITLQGFRQDVPDLLAAADIFVLPSLWEGLPIGLLEAMAMGKAVIASKVDGTMEIVKDGENGILIETDDLVPALANALVKLSHDGPLRMQFGKKAVETIGNRFTADAMTRKIEEIYKRLVQAPVEKH